MCGICGVVGDRDAERQAWRMLRAMPHRGPDNTSVWHEGPVALGHARLSIVDISAAGNQPMWNEAETIALVGNGEIYNAPGLRSSLEASGHVFRSKSDNEVLLHLYEEKGENFLDHINGMLACALYDRVRGHLLLGRDRLGIKPLYYSTDGGRIAFASEIKALVSQDSSTAQVDHQGFAQYLSYQNTLGDKTLFAGIRMVRPGEVIVFEGGVSRSRSFWQLPKPRGERLRPDRNSLLDEFRGILGRSVGRHLIADVAVGSYLSGGFDSTGVAATAIGLSTTQIQTFTGSFDAGGWYDETPEALAAGRMMGAPPSLVSIGSRDFADTLDDVIFHLDEPRMGMGALPQFSVARAAARNVRVILTGHGGDELFAGYPSFKFVHLQNALGRGHLAPLTALRFSEIAPLTYFLAGSLWKTGAKVGVPCLFGDAARGSLILPDIAACMTRFSPSEDHADEIGADGSAYDRLMRHYLRVYLPGLFVVEDKISMAHGLESRTPLCDNEMLDFALGLTLDQKLHGGRLKSIIKDGLADRLPAELYRAPKRGFPTPLAEWISGPLRPFLRDRLLGGSLRQVCSRPRLESQVQSIFRSAMLPPPFNELAAQRAWMLLSLEAWIRTFKDRLQVSIAF